MGQYTGEDLYHLATRVSARAVSSLGMLPLLSEYGAGTGEALLAACCSHRHIYNSLWLLPAPTQPTNTLVLLSLFLLTHASIDGNLSIWHNTCCPVGCLELA